MNKPRFRHDCDACRFLDHYESPRDLQDYDLYYCPNTELGGSLIARYDSDPPRYASMAMDIFETGLKSMKPGDHFDRYINNVGLLHAYKLLKEKMRPVTIEWEEHLRHSVTVYTDKTVDELTAEADIDVWFEEASVRAPMHYRIAEVLDRRLLSVLLDEPDAPKKEDPK